jgi:hypothetical protein
MARAGVSVRRRALIVLSSLERAVYVALRRAHGDTPTEISRAQIAALLVDGTPSVKSIRVALKALEAVGLVEVDDSRSVIAALDIPSSVDVTGLSRDSRIADLTFDDPSV